MAVTAKLETPPRWRLTFHSAESFADDLGSMGSWVGPRTGPDKRTHGQKEDYVLRRILAAWKRENILSYSMEVTAGFDGSGEPDFLITWPNSDTLGVEITEAGDESYQAWLTHIDTDGSQKSAFMSNDGYVGSNPERMAASDIITAISKKVSGYDKGKYRTPDSCDLLVYSNSETGWISDKKLLLKFVGRPDELLGRFRQIHIVVGEIVYLDAFGNDFREVDVRNTYEIDYAAWIFDQIKQMRGADGSGLDLDLISEELADLGRSERRALGSHLKNLMIHLLKWEFQPERRGQSWRLSIDNARSEIFELLTEMPSLRHELEKRRNSEYTRARRTAALETELDVATFPQKCPYSKEQLVDPQFYAGEDNEPDRGRDD